MRASRGRGSRPSNASSLAAVAVAVIRRLGVSVISVGLSHRRPSIRVRLIVLRVSVILAGGTFHQLRFRVRLGVMAPQPPRDKHESPDRDDAYVQEDAAHVATSPLASRRVGTALSQARTAESAVIMSRTVKGWDRIDEHSVRCVARSAAAAQLDHAATDRTDGRSDGRACHRLARSRRDQRGACGRISPAVITG